MRMRKFILLLFIVSVYIHLSAKVYNYTMRDGLASNTIDYIEQDSEGFLYFCTDRGLSIFDGTSFQTYDNPKNTSLFSNKVSSIVEVDSMHLLIASEDKGLFLFDKLLGEISVIPNSEILQITSLFKDSSGRIWIGLKNGQVGYIDNFLYFLQGREKIEYKEITMNFEEVNAIYELDGYIWILSECGSIYMLQKKEDQVDIEKVIVGDETLDLYVLQPIESDRILVGTSNGIRILRKVNRQWCDDQISILSHSKIRSMALKENNVYIGTEGNGLYTWNISQGLEFQTSTLRRHQEVGLDFIISMKVDKVGSLWVGSWLGGVSQLTFSPNGFTIIRNQENVKSIFSNTVWCITNTLLDSTVYLGTHGAGLCQYVPEAKTFRVIDKTYPSIQSFWVDSGAECMYVGTWGQGLKKFNLKFQRYVPFSFPELSSDRIYSILRVSENQLLIGTAFHGLWLFDEKLQQGKRLKILDTISPLNIRSIIKDQERGGFWVGTFNSGLFYVKLADNNHVASVEHVLIDDKLDRQILSLFLQDNTLFIGLVDGVGVLDLSKGKGEVQMLAQLKGLRVLDIASYEEDKYIFCTYSGLILFDRRANLVKNYDPTNIYYACKKSVDSDKMYIATFDGMVDFDPRVFNSTDLEGRVIFNSLHVNGRLIYPKDSMFQYLSKSINYVDSLFLAPSHRNISVKTSVMSFMPPFKGRLFYKLEGLDDNWNESGDFQTDIRYLNLPAGDYRLRVRINSAENIINERFLSIHKEEYWWRTRTAFLCYLGLIVIMIGCCGYWFRRRYKKKYIQKLVDIKKKKEEELYEQKIRFFTNLSHDLKTPLTLILTPLNDLISHPEMPESFKRRLQSMLLNGEHLLRKINKMLKYKELEGEDEPLKWEVFTVRQLLYEIILPFKEYAQYQGITFDYCFSQEEEKTVYILTDKAKLESVLENLISNAIKYTPETGCVNITITLDKELLYIDICDTGVGISAEDLSHLFDRYYRISADNRGTGIGLYLVKHYLDLLQGEIQVESVQGKGSSFHLKLPLLYDSETENPVKEMNMEGNLLESDNVKSLLIVDDNKEIRDYFYQTFSSFYKVLRASTGDEALEIARQELPDLILSDYMMPGMNGLELCKAIKEDMLTSHIPFVILSARASDEIRLECWEQGVDLFEEKPFRRELLQIKLATLIRNRKLLKYKYQIASPDISAIQNEEQSHLQKNTSLDEQFLQRLNDVIEKNRDKTELSVLELAESLSMKHDQLYRKLKALTGLTVNQYIRSYRLNCAVALLKSQQFSVTEVLYRVGFSNPSYFTKCFKKEFGLLPSEFVDQINKDSN